jgi:AraC-like DNA-binding protein
MFYIAGIAIAFFLAIVLFGKSGKGQPDYILGAWLVVIGIHLTFFYAHIDNFYLRFPHLLGLSLPFPLLHGPFLYLYVASLTGQAPRRWAWFAHFLPVPFVYLLFGEFFMASAAEKLSLVQAQGTTGHQSLFWILNILINLSGPVYLVWSMMLLKRHQKNIKHQYSSLDKINLRWLRNLVIGLCAIWVAVVYGNDQVIFTLAVGYVVFIGYYGIKQVGIFTHVPPLVFTPASNEPAPSFHELAETTFVPPAQLGQPAVKYQKSGLGEAAAQALHQTLLHLMATEKLFTNPELTLPELAQKLGVHSNTLSQVINSREQTNFFDFINSLRVEEFKRMVVQPDNQKFTLLALALACGFNSKTSFNRNFKRATQLTPTEYLKSQNILLF